MALVVNIGDTVNLCILTGKYKKPCYILILLSFNYYTFPSNLISANCINFPNPIPNSHPYYSALPFY